VRQLVRKLELAAAFRYMRARRIALMRRFDDVLARVADNPAGALPNSYPGTGIRSTPSEPARSPSAQILPTQTK
jgi:hypothetical protein